MPPMEEAAAKYRVKKKNDYLLNELWMQRQIAAMHLGALVEALDVDDTTKAWGQAQGFLGAASIVSLCLWPAKDDYKERGEALRGQLNVPDNLASQAARGEERLPAHR